MSVILSDVSLGEGTVGKGDLETYEVSEVKYEQFGSLQLHFEFWIP